MRVIRLRNFVLALGACALATSAALGTDFQWQVVVNNGVIVPGDTRAFNSYSQPSINLNRLVTFRARSKTGSGSSGQPDQGIFARNMASGTPVYTIFDRTTLVPYPNNLNKTFINMASFPRIDMNSSMIASPGIHSPVWQFQVNPETTTRVGTSGIYATRSGTLITGASKLGVVPDFSFFSVPEWPGLGFDVFPGSPGVTDGATIVFKGNYMEGIIGRTGVYYRDLANAPAGGTGPVITIANTASSLIPGSATLFGSTAPPSAVGRLAVFAGFDNEDAPTLGGIYSAPLDGTTRPPLTTLVAVGEQVPGEADGVVFNKFGEGVSFDGRFVGFWGAWGTETKSLILQCPTDGDANLIAFCLQKYPQGYATTVPLHQGVFVHDLETGETMAVVKAPEDFDDFVFWVFSGIVPGTGSGDSSAEPARWRAAQFVAVSGLVDGSLADAGFDVAFKARTGELVAGAYVNPIDGIYLRQGPTLSPIAPVVVSGMPGTLFDPQAADAETGLWLPVSAMGIERDGFRGHWLTIGASMATAEAGWAGVYLTQVPEDLTAPCYAFLTQVSPPGAGTVTVNTPENCTGGYTAGTEISLTAAAAAGFAFSGWSGGGGTFSSTATPSTTFTLASGAGANAAFVMSGAASPADLDVDAAKNGELSDGNGMLEPGETTELAPWYTNISPIPISFTGAASGFTGPGSASLYTIGDGAATYGPIAPGITDSCATAKDCYALTLGAPAVRPAAHWDAQLTETLSDGTAKTWTLHVGDSFSDVPRSYLLYIYVEALFHHEVTLGYGDGTFRPDDVMSRAQMTMFIARASLGGDANVPLSGAGYDCTVPGSATNFPDVFGGDQWCPHANWAYVNNVADTCDGSGDFCPLDNASRVVMGIEVSRALPGIIPSGDAAIPAAYSDPDTGRSYSCNPGSPNIPFSDVSASDPFCKNVCYIWARGIIDGFLDGTYGVALDVTRGQMSKYLVNAFKLALYGP